MRFHCTWLGVSIVLGWEVPLYWAGRFHCTGLGGSIVLGWEVPCTGLGVPLHWAGRFHCIGLGFHVLGWRFIVLDSRLS